MSLNYNREGIIQVMENICLEAKNIFVKHEAIINKAHGWDHVQRVFGAAVKIANLEKNVNLDEVKIAVYLHDIGRYKESSMIKHAAWSYHLAKPILENYKNILLENKIDKNKILKIIRFHSEVNCIDDVARTIEYKIVVDADLIDSFGPIGILRASLDPRFTTIKSQIDHISNKAKEDNYMLKTNKNVLLAEELTARFLIP